MDQLIPRPNRAPLWAVLLAAAAYTILRMAGYGILEVGLAGFLLALALYLLIDWAIEKRSAERTRENESAQEDLKIMKEVKLLTPEQLEQLKDLRIIRQHLFPAMGPAKHTWAFQESMTAIPQHFTTEEVISVWQNCTPDYFVAVSTWDDGTRRRNLAELLYRKWNRDGYLLPATGNRPARWIGDGYELARKELEDAR